MSAHDTDDTSLRTLAEAVGLILEWEASDGSHCTLDAVRQREMLARLGWPAADAAEVNASLARWREQSAPYAWPALPPLLIADADMAFPVPLVQAAGLGFSLRLESGETLGGKLDAMGCLPPIDACGYHRLTLSDAGGERLTRTLAVAPARCFTPADVRAEGTAARLWGVAVQLYSLRREGDTGIGDLQALDELCAGLAEQGADAVAVSPIHALFAADPQRYSPYAPSSRLFYNVWHAAPECVFDAATVAWAAAPDRVALAQRSQAALIDWPASVALKQAQLERLYHHVMEAEEAQHWQAQFEAFCEQGGEALERHCRFEVLQAEAKERDWRHWPSAWRDPRSAEVEAFADSHVEAVRFAAFLQWLMAAGLERVQQQACEAGMAIGLIADLAVGVDPCGSQAWSFPGELLTEFSVGAPPDAFNARGQDWGVAAFSPSGLVGSGYRGFIAMLRAGFAHAGGLRIDHVLGLSRLWLIPQGEPADHGAYLRFPLDDLLRLVALESWRHRAIVIGEDLGTVEAGLRDNLASRGVLGIGVLWFERDGDDFLAAPAWRQGVLATTTTHDLPTVAGWWQGRDLDWRERLGLFGEGETRVALDAQRQRDRARLAARCGIAETATPATVVDAALGHIAATPTPLTLLPLEDLLALSEQPNLPGTLDEHPNWRRRLPLPVAQLVTQEALQRRLAHIQDLRGRAGSRQGVSS